MKKSLSRRDFLFQAAAIGASTGLNITATSAE
ncbi:MAG: twin-arginine translocation signal domain-containing protein, partial [bacterium]